MSDSTYILSIPGTDQTQELSRGEVLAGMARGEITPDHWVWSAADNDWKQISEIADLRPQPRGAVTPSFVPIAITPVQPVLPTLPVVATPTPVAAEPIFPTLPTKTLPVVQPLPPMPVPAAQPVVIPPVRTFAPIQPITPIAIEPIEPIRADGKKIKRKKVKARSHRVKEEQEGFPWLQVIFGVVYVAVAVIIFLNYFYVDKPFDGKMAKTPFVLVPAHAHLGSFVQQNALVIHVLPNSEVTPDNFAEFLATLAQSTPQQPFKEEPFQIVDLTSKWVGQYGFLGPDWERLGLLEGANAEAQKNFVLDHLSDVTGQPLIRDPQKLKPAELQAERARIWQTLVANFTKA